MESFPTLVQLTVSQLQEDTGIMKISVLVLAFYEVALTVQTKQQLVQTYLPASDRDLETRLSCWIAISSAVLETTAITRASSLMMLPTKQRVILVTDLLAQVTTLASATVTMTPYHVYTMHSQTLARLIVIRPNQESSFKDQSKFSL